MLSIRWPTTSQVKSSHAAHHEHELTMAWKHTLFTSTVTFTYWTCSTLGSFTKHSTYIDYIDDDEPWVSEWTAKRAWQDGWEPLKEWVMWWEWWCGGYWERREEWVGGGIDRWIRYLTAHYCDGTSILLYWMYVCIGHYYMIRTTDSRWTRMYIFYASPR